MFRKQQLKTATVKRSTYTTGTYKKSSYLAISKSYNGHLKALTVEDGITIESLGKEFSFTTNSGADIKEADKLVIDGIEYEVRGVQRYWGITFNTLKVSLTKSGDGG